MRGPSFWTGACALIGRRMGANSLLFQEPSESGLSAHKSTTFAGEIPAFHPPPGPGRPSPLAPAAGCGETRQAMSDSPQFLEVGAGSAARRIAVRLRGGASPGLFWLGGFKSDMQGTKAAALDGWAAKQGRACI